MRESFAKEVDVGYGDSSPEITYYPIRWQIVHFSLTGFTA